MAGMSTTFTTTIDSENTVWALVAAATGLSGVAVADKVAELVATGDALALNPGATLRLWAKGSVLVGKLNLDLCGVEVPSFEGAEVMAARRTADGLGLSPSFPAPVPGKVSILVSRAGSAWVDDPAARQEFAFDPAEIPAAELEAWLVSQIERHGVKLHWTHEDAPEGPIEPERWAVAVRMVDGSGWAGIAGVPVPEVARQVAAAIGA